MGTTVQADGTTRNAEFSEWFERLRMNRGFNLTELAKAVHLHRDTVKRIDSGDGLGRLPIATWESLAEALGIDLGYLLSKAGFDIGVSGTNLKRLARVEEVTDAYQTIEHSVREALSAAMVAVDKPGPLKPVREGERNALIVTIGRGLAQLDLATERLRELGVMDVLAKRHERAVPRPWTEEDRNFIDEHSEWSSQDLAAALGRTYDAVRIYRARTKSND